ncbi:hypothetical protein GN156_36605, partial [bacterium LRH843]|nr:hypothetical protein [bacterium LRH843]
EGGYIEQTKETMEKVWNERTDQFGNRPKAKLPKWFGERPGKKKDDPESPEEEEVKKDDEVEEPVFEAEEEEEEEAEEEEE